MNPLSENLKEAFKKISKYFPKDFIHLAESNTAIYIYIGDADYEIDKTSGKFRACGSNIGTGKLWEIKKKDW